MEENNICIRKAHPQDTEDIFWLLHSESMHMPMANIERSLNSLYVMTYKDKLVGAASCILKGNGREIKWTAIHPMYPEKALSSIMKGSLENLNLVQKSLSLELCTE